MVSDGMSSGTLNMADRLLHYKNGKGSYWLDLYREGKISRALCHLHRQIPRRLISRAKSQCGFIHAGFFFFHVVHLRRFFCGIGREF